MITDTNGYISFLQSTTAAIDDEGDTGNTASQTWGEQWPCLIKDNPVDETRRHNDDLVPKQQYRILLDTPNSGSLGQRVRLWRDGEAMGNFAVRSSERLWAVDQVEVIV